MDDGIAQAPTRDRLVTATADLFRTSGYHATSVKEIVERAGAPFGSMYHHFPGGKVELGDAAITSSGSAYGELIDLFFHRPLAHLIAPEAAPNAGFLPRPQHRMCMSAFWTRRMRWRLFVHKHLP